MLFLPGTVEEEHFVSGPAQRARKPHLTSGPPAARPTQKYQVACRQDRAQAVDGIAAKDHFARGVERARVGHRPNLAYQMAFVNVRLTEREWIRNHMGVEHPNCGSQSGG